MDSDRILIGALIFILIVVGSNVAMYAIARGWTKSGDSRWMSALRDSLSKPMQNQSNQSMDELRKQVVELEKKKNGDNTEPE
jgi:hypothetical protein